MNLLNEIKKRVEQSNRIDQAKKYKAERINKLRAKNLFIDEAIIKQKISYVNR